MIALDATTGAEQWTFTPKQIDNAAKGVACCDLVSRGAVYHEGRVFFATLDGHAIAVDAKTGKEVWSTTIADISKGESITMAPIVAAGKIRSRARRRRERVGQRNAGFAGSTKPGGTLYVFALR